MRPLTLDLDLLAAALDSRERGTHFLDLESGALRLLDPDDLSLEEREELEDPERYLPLPRLTQDDRLELREAFLHQLRHPHAQPLLRAALESRRPIRTFDYELELFPSVRKAWQAFALSRLKEEVLVLLDEAGLEALPADGRMPLPDDVPEGIRRRLEKGQGR